MRCRALILRARACGESNREAWLLGEGAGLFRATVFGGPKSRLRSHASPFHSGTAWVYLDPVRDARKLADFDVSAWRPGIRELYERAMAADAVAETVLASHGGGGSWGGALSLAESALDAISAAGGEGCRAELPRFLWRWAGFLGLRPDLSRCSLCGRPAPAGRSLRFSPRDGGVACAACLGGSPAAGLVGIGAACREWLEAGLPGVPGAREVREAKALSEAVLAGALGRRLASWDW